MRKRSAATLLLSALAACATPGQVRRVGIQIAVLDREHARADSARAADLSRVLAMQSRLFDSIMAVGRNFDESLGRVSRETASEFTDLRRQMLSVVEMTGQNQSAVARLRAELQTGSDAQRGDSLTGRAGAGLSADALNLSAQQQLRQGARSTARGIFRNLVETYPSSPLVPDAILGIGKTFDPAEPDSAKVYYSQVVQRFPDAMQSATALFKMGSLSESRGDTAGARAYYQQVVVDKFKPAVEYELAQLRLRGMP